MPMVTAGYSVWGALVLNLVENWYSQFITSYYLSLLFITSITAYYCLLPFITFLYCLLLHITLYNLLLLFFTVYYFILPFITFCLFGLSSPPSWAVQPTLLGCSLLRAVQPIFRNLWAVQPTHFGCPAHPCGLSSPPTTPSCEDSFFCQASVLKLLHLLSRRLSSQSFDNFFFHECGRRVGMVHTSSLKKGRKADGGERNEDPKKPTQNQTPKPAGRLHHLVVFPKH